MNNNLSPQSPFTTTDHTFSPPPSPSGDEITEQTWYGNIQYLLNISAIGTITCLLIFLFVKLRSDHRRMPGPTAIVSKLLAVWHATGREIARHCGADAAQFLLIEGVRGFPAGNDGRLMDTVLLIMRICVDLFLVAMTLFFSVRGDSTKLQAILTVAVLVVYKLLPCENDGFQPALLQSIQSVENVVDGPVDYEVLSEPKFEWDTYYS
uniref:CSC1/OSCA1-like N-terminal transmembrane domain-containing protein n=1 Tax=Helianthus annuus TaxID=4232 RepID=A0A251SH76_HELAN